MLNTNRHFVKYDTSSKWNETIKRHRQSTLDWMRLLRTLTNIQAVKSIIKFTSSYWGVQNWLAYKKIILWFIVGLRMNICIRMCVRFTLLISYCKYIHYVTILLNETFFQLYWPTHTCTSLYTHTIFQQITYLHSLTYSYWYIFILFHFFLPPPPPPTIFSFSFGNHFLG